jgi:hypothetical protein
MTVHRTLVKILFIIVLAHLSANAQISPGELTKAHSNSRRNE